MPFTKNFRFLDIELSITSRAVCEPAKQTHYLRTTPNQQSKADSYLPQGKQSHIPFTPQCLHFLAFTPGHSLGAIYSLALQIWIRAKREYINCGGSGNFPDHSDLLTFQMNCCPFPKSQDIARDPVQEKLLLKVLQTFSKRKVSKNAGCHLCLLCFQWSSTVSSLTDNYQMIPFILGVSILENLGYKSGYTELWDSRAHSSILTNLT